MCNSAHIGDAAASHGMRELNSGYARHTQRLGDKVSLGPEFLSDERNRGDASVGQVDAVTHGAGSARSSVAVGSDNTHALATNLPQQLFTGGNRCIALVVGMNINVGQ